jgi:uncharacterized membrane-anchored protein
MVILNMVIKMKIVKGIIKKGKRTKELVKTLSQGDIALIKHKDIDEVAAESLSDSKIKAVINIEEYISGKYPNKGPALLLEKGIPLFQMNPRFFEIINNGEKVYIKDDYLYNKNGYLTALKRLSKTDIDRKINIASNNFQNQLSIFIDNTLSHAMDEKSIIVTDLNLPSIDTNIKNKHVLVVSRGHNYKQDLLAIENYIREIKPIIVGVDGGADILIDYGLKPDVIVGDMDSISDRALLTPCEIIVHAYSDGKAPGLKRVKDLGLSAKVIPATGTSEDLALLMAYQLGAKLIVAVGSHSNMIDFLEKGRNGMASTLLVRMKIGSILVDAKGVSLLYKRDSVSLYVSAIIASSLIPLAIVLLRFPPLYGLVKLLVLKFRLMTGL